MATPKTNKALLLKQKANSVLINHSRGVNPDTKL